MEEIQAYIDKQRDKYAEHVFFSKIHQFSNTKSLIGFLRMIAFWPMVFQDLLRLNVTRIKDPYLLRIAKHHRIEDADHDDWYVFDLDYCYGEKQSSSEFFRWIFNKKFTAVRDMSYALISEVFRADEDYLNIVLLLALEPTGHVFFENITKVTIKLGCDNDLKYFATKHLDVEHDHAIFEQKLKSDLFSNTLNPTQRAKAEALVDRVYTAVNAMFDALIPYLDAEINNHDRIHESSAVPA